MNNFRQRLCFSTPTASDVLLDHERKNEFQDLIVFFGTDETGNVITLCINQIYRFKQLNSFVCIRRGVHTGLELTGKETDYGTYEFSSWKTTSLQFQCVVPMQTWRIVFSGRLRSQENLHHVKINFLWKPFGFPVYCDKNNTFFKHEIDNVHADIARNLLGFDQFGQVSGAIVVDGKTEMINMRAMKIRRWNMSMNDSVFAGFTDDGICSVQKLEWINCRGHLKTNSEHEMLTSNEIRFSNEENDEPPTTSISIQHGSFDLNANLKNQTPTIVLNSVSIETVFEDGLKGVFLCFRDAPKHEVKIKFEQICVNGYAGLTVNLDSDVCTHNDIVGNKAKSLFRLKKAIVNGMIDNNANVPDGMCVTTIAMRNHITGNEDLLNGLNDTIAIAKQNDFGLLSDRCERLKKQWRSSKPSAELLEAISNGIRKHGVYAVRSSGTFEDGERTSSAGQYTTELNCAGCLEDVVAAVFQCWSSNFSARALTYRKNNGQPLMCHMAVIVQDQVYGRVAGVAFTRDPNTGDPEKITIAATYGPGEEVVSGSTEPDAVVVRRKFNCKDSTATTSNFIVERNDDDEPAKSRVPDDLLKKLAALCVQVEDVFGSPQDIEWTAGVQDRIYLVQSRPITSIFAWSNDEITREFDTPFAADDVVMFYNVKEVYPYPMHPLSLTLDFFSTHPLFKLSEGEPTDVYRNRQLFHTHYNLCLNACQMFQDLEVGSVYVKIIEYSIAGKCFLTDDIWQRILSRKRSSVFKKCIRSFLTFKEILYLESRLVETSRLISSVNVEQSDSASGLLHNINVVMDVFEKVNFCHVASSTNNIVAHTLLATLGLGFNKDSTIESLSNLAGSISTPDIINVSILKDIQAIADVISEMPSKKEFCDLPVGNCCNWLKLNCEKGYSQVGEFIENYGHRGVQELDFGSETWSTDPDRLFSCLQSLVLSSHRQSHIKPNTENNSGTVSRGYIKRMIFDYLLNKYRQSISYREQSKDMLVQITHKLRFVYRKLGEKLVDEERIPDSKLVFFMSQYELKKICDNNRPEIVYKALKRRKLWPTLFSLQFDDVYCGPPMPTNTCSDQEPDSWTTQLKGCCVFPGRVKNRACVLERIEDARHHLRPGDVLIVKSVDVAWSPYFPIISGLVTEIGGIISHGAVVAREYGLPCIVGVKNAKKHFKMDDVVILDSEKGFVMKESRVTN